MPPTIKAPHTLLASPCVGVTFHPFSRHPDPCRSRRLPKTIKLRIGMAAGLVGCLALATGSMAAAASTAPATTASPIGINAASLPFGTLTVDGVSTQQLIVTDKGAAAVTLQSASITGVGFQVVSSGLPKVLQPGQSAALFVQFAPRATGSVSGVFKLATTTNSAAVSVPVSGAAVAPQIVLNWSAPETEDLPSSFRLYRAPSGGLCYALVATIAGQQTDYVDTKVAANSSYGYYLTSVDADGNESTPSIPITVVVP